MMNLALVSFFCRSWRVVWQYASADLKVPTCSLLLSQSQVIDQCFSLSFGITKMRKPIKHDCNTRPLAIKTIIYEKPDSSEGSPKLAPLVAWRAPQVWGKEGEPE